MALRFSGDVEIRLTCKPYVGDNGKRELFYFAHVRAPGHIGNGILSPREAGVGMFGDPKSSDNYDKAARAFIVLAEVDKFANMDGDDFEILRVQQAPCPTGCPDGGRDPAPRARGRRKVCCAACAKGKPCSSGKKR